MNFAFACSEKDRRSTFLGTPVAGQLLEIQPPHCSFRIVLAMQKEPDKVLLVL